MVEKTDVALGPRQSRVIATVDRLHLIEVRVQNQRAVEGHLHAPAAATIGSSSGAKTS